jgi:hypothetical protein
MRAELPFAQPLLSLNQPIDKFFLRYPLRESIARPKTDFLPSHLLSTDSVLGLSQTYPTLLIR